MKEIKEIKRFLNFSKGNYSYNDYLRVKEWFQSPLENDEIKEHLIEQWNEVSNKNIKKDGSLNHVFKKIHYDILLQEKTKSSKITIWRYYRQIAAILMIPVLAFSLWYFISSKNVINKIIPQETAQSWMEINAPDGARVEFLLPDSSKGWLNSGSKLKYPVIFGNQRKVELSGEAWFDIKHKEGSEFIVSVPDMNVKVLGTQFNVSAYAEDAFTDVVLEEGKVEIYGKTGMFSQTLSPNEKITYDHELRSLAIAEVNANRFSAWKDGYLVIDNEPLFQVISRLERWYNVDIVVQDEVLKKYHFKATFKDEPLEEVLKLIAKTTPISYTIDKRVTDSEGVLIQKKVTLKLKQ